MKKHLTFLVMLAMHIYNNVCAQEKIIILNEGLWQSDNGRISYFEDGKVISNQWFRDKNGYKLGDTPSDIVQVNDNLIAINVNWSNIIQFIRPDGTAVATIEGIPNNRKLCTDGKYVYVSSYGHECETVNGTVYFEKGFVAKIDINSFKVIATCEVGYEPEGIALYKGYLFVPNSGGYSGVGEDHDYERTVSIVDASTLTLVKNVDTGIPNLYGKMSQSGRYLCINSPGDYYEVPPCGLVFDCEKALNGDDCFVVFDYPATYNTTTLDGKFLVVGSAYSFMTGGYDFVSLTIDPQTVMATQGASGIWETLPGTMSNDIMGMTQPYGIYVNPYTGYMYATDSGNYTGSGDLYQWSPEGTLLGTHKLYINPGHFLALPPDDWGNGIKDLNTPKDSKDPNNLYDLSGRKVSSPTPGRSGIYIKSGKKVLYNSQLRQ